MKDHRQQYLQEISKAKETVGILESELHEIRLKLQKMPMDAVLMQDLKKVTLDMTITLNELEHSQTAYERCLQEYTISKEAKYND